jgi:hypothetical protein
MTGRMDWVDVPSAAVTPSDRLVDTVEPSCVLELSPALTVSERFVDTVEAC